MSDRLLDVALSRIGQQIEEEQAQIDKEKAALETELVEIRSAFRELDLRQQKASQMLYEHKRKTESLATEKTIAQAQAIADAMQNSKAHLQKIEEFSSRLEGLEGTRQSLLAANSALEKNWQAYQAYLGGQAKSRATLDALPEQFRDALQRTYEDLKRSVSPILELEEQAQEWPSLDHPVIQLILTKDSKSNRMIWLLPIPADDNAMGFDAPIVSRTFERAVLNAVVELVRSPAWVIEKTVLTTSAGFSAIELEAFYEGQQPLVDCIGDAIRPQLSLNLLFQKAMPDLRITEIEWSLWELFVSVVKDRIPKKLSDSVELEAESTSDFDNLLFTERDLKSWQARVPETSEWTTAARRLRTLIMRLSAVGYVGQVGVESEQVWMGLPGAHRTSLQALLPALLEGEVLSAVDSIGGGKRVALNPAHLNDIQALVNRELTSFWAPLVSLSP